MRVIGDVHAQHIAVNWMHLDIVACCSRESLFVFSSAGISLARLC